MFSLSPGRFSLSPGRCGLLLLVLMLFGCTGAPAQTPPRRRPMQPQPAPQPAPQTTQPTTQPTPAAPANTRPAQSPAGRGKGPVRPGALVALVNDARAVPAEFAADALLRLVESGRITERAWQRELLAEAFRTAAAAQQPLKRRIAPGLGYAYTREDYQARAAQLGLDALSLRLRAIAALLKLDPPAARALFAELPPRPPLAPLTCADALVYDVADFYTMLQRIAHATFSPAERARGADVEFVLPYLDDMHAPAQTAPLAALVGKLGDTPARLATLLHAYSAALNRIAADDRSFTAESGPHWQMLAQLTAAAQEQEVAPAELLAAFRAYTVRHLHAARCADTAAAQNGGDRRGVLYFNERARAADPGGQTSASIAPADVLPAGSAGVAALTLYWTTPAAQTIFRAAQELRFAMTDDALPAAAEPDVQRALKLNDWLNALADWRAPDAATEADYFTERCVIYQLLLEVWPAGAARDGLLREYVAFLRQPARQQENPAGWLLHVRRLLTGPAYTDSARARLLEVLSSAGDPVLRLYAELDKLPPVVVKPRP